MLLARGLRSFVIVFVPLSIFGSLIADDRLTVPTEVRVKDCRIKLLDQVTLSTDRPGILKFVEHSEGDSVAELEVVAGLQDEMIRAELLAAEHKASNDIEVRANEKASELAEMEHRRAEKANLAFEKAVPLVEFHRLRLTAEKAVLDIEMARHDFVFNGLQRDFKRAELSTYTVLAPFNGVVTKVYKRRGEAVRQGDPILELTNTDRVRVEGWIDLVHAWKVAPGQRVLVRLNLPEIQIPGEKNEFEGRITFVDVSVNPVALETKVFAEVVNHDNILRAGLTADMVVKTDQKVSPAVAGQSKQRGLSRNGVSAISQSQQTMKVPLNSTPEALTDLATQPK